MIAYYDYEVRSELESIFQTKINSLNIDHGISTSPQASDDIVFPTAAPRKASSKDHRAPSAPSTPTSISSGNMSPGHGSYTITTEHSDTANHAHNNKNKIRKTNVSKIKSSKAPQPPQLGRSSPDKKEKVTIKISKMENSETNYSTLERKK